MTNLSPQADQSLLISSAPLGWPNITIEVRLMRAGTAIDEAPGPDRHCLMFWDQHVDASIAIEDVPLKISQLMAPIVLVPSGMRFHCQPLSSNRFKRLLIDAAFVARLAEERLGLKTFSLQPAAFEGDYDLRGIAYLLAEAVTGHQPLDAEMIAVLARETAIHLASNYSDMRTPRPDLNGRIPTPKLVRVLDYLAANLDKRLSVSVLAREAGLSLAHFSRAFAKSTGRAPHAYIMGRRVAKAEHLLRNSSDPIDKIAAQCGFHDQAHLNRVFKRATGHTPRVFRSRVN